MQMLVSEHCFTRRVPKRNEKNFFQEKLLKKYQDPSKNFSGVRELGKPRLQRAAWLFVSALERKKCLSWWKGWCSASFLLKLY